MFTNTNLSSYPATLRRVITGALLVMIGAGVPARSGDLLRGGATAQVPGAVPVYGSTTATSPQARANANDTLARATQATQAFQAMQAAAHNLAVAGANNLGIDPNHPGTQLPNVPNGLVLGGLVPDSGLSVPGTANPVTTWTGANTPTQTVSGAQTTVNVTQTAQQAVLNWQTFNVGKSTTLNINQSMGAANVSQWIAFNIVNDPSGIPSQILGSIQAAGQVYLVNQNGIIFGGASQVNVHTLVASSLPINTNLISLGLLNNPDDQFLFSQLPISQGANGTPAFTPPVPNTPSGLDGDVTVQPGAAITAPANAENVGGRVALIGPNVTNAGSISTPDGQTILAAGNQVGMAAHSSNDPSLRGLDVYVGAVDQFSGNATNSGVISAAEGDVTITGKSVNQLGAIDSTTSVTLNGRIDLLADYDDITSGGQGSQPFLPTATGPVTLGAGSVTQILPELDNTDQVVGTELALSSLVNIQGSNIYMAPNSTLLAPGATTPSNSGQPALGIGGLALSTGVTLNAGDWLSNELAIAINPSNGESFVHSNGQIYLDAGAMIDVAGSQNVSASVTENIVSAQLRGAELADSPLQRDGVLRGQTVEVDILQSGIYNGVDWVGTPLADLSGYVGLVEHTVGELTVNAGSVSLTAGESVVMQPGSAINVSGGSINYQGAMVQTTKLISGGHIYDISQATPNLVYQGILGGFTVDDVKWGVSQTFQTLLLGGPYYEAGYVEGGNGGSVSITAPSMALDGDLFGSTVAGPRQQVIPPTLSSLSLVFQAQDPNVANYVPDSPTPPNIVFEPAASLVSVGSFTLDSSGDPLPLPPQRQAVVVLTPALLTDDGFGALNVSDSAGNITVPANISLVTPAGGSITFSGANIDIEGRLIAPSGVLSFTTNDLSPYLVLNSTPTPDPSQGKFTLGALASLSTAGLLVNDIPGSSAPFTLSLADDTNGGSVTINGYSADLSAGSVINVSGGADVGETTSGARSISYGKGGSIAISIDHISIDDSFKTFLGGQLVLDSALQGYSGGSGGSLSILAPLIQIGGAATAPGTLLLSPDFFNQGGFASFGLSGIGAGTPTAFEYVPAIDIAPGTVIAPVATSYIAVPDGNNFSLVPALLAQGVRSPVSLSFDALGLNHLFGDTDPLTGTALEIRGDFVMGQGAVILTDPQSNEAKGVSISGATVAVLGSIIAPGGSITITGAQDSSTIFLTSGGGIPPALPTVDLGPQSLLSTAGATLLTPDPTGMGYRTGSVLNGGNITISGNIVAEAGSVINVSGAADILDLPPADSGLNTQFTGLPKPILYIPTIVDSDGGSITLKGQQELFTDATLLGAPGGPSAEGGSLTIESGINGAGNSPLSVNLIITQDSLTIPVPFYSAGQTAIGHAVVDAHGNIIPGLGYFAADSFNNSGLFSLSLEDTVQFSGPVNITANGSLTVATGGVIFADSAVTLTAPYVALGTPFLTPLQAAQEPQAAFVPPGGGALTFSPTYGPGSLTVNANLIDIGYLSLQNIGNANFYAINGDIRGDGGLDVAGNIFMEAGQIYPPTEQTFTIVAYDYLANSMDNPGTVTIVGSGIRQLPLSAGGILNIYGSIINQGGVLRAPIGTINLGWDGIGSSPVDEITGAGLASEGVTATASIPVTQQLTLSNGSVTSVSAVDPVTGQGILIPYGINLNGTQWIDPAGNDITTTTSVSGVPQKAVNISAVNVADNAGAVIDLRGGGDLYAYRFVSGTGGGTDILASNSSFAVIPGYQADFTPYAPYNPNPLSGFITGDAGYVNTSLVPGDRIFLSGGDGLAGGYYTLLPARYALLPGAFLITPSSSQVTTTAVINPDGSSIMPGYLVSAGQGGQPLRSSFEVDPQSVVQSLAEYDNFYASSYLAQSAIANNTTVPRLPVDAGQLVLQATQSMSILGTFFSQAPDGGRGAQVDINTSVDILINSTGVDNAFNGLVLDSSDLTAIGAESLLIGGVRQEGSGGMTVTVSTDNLTVDNSGAPLAGTDIILVANDNLTLAPGSEIMATGALSNAESLLLGNFATPGSGNGTLLRVSSDPSAQIARFGVSASTVPDMVIGAGVVITGASITLDSTYGTSLDPTAIVTGQAVNLDSGQISIQLTNPGAVAPTAGLILSGQALQNLQASAHALSLLSYSSIDIYGTGQVGGDANAAGQFPVASLTLDAAEIRGFNNGGGTVTFAAQNIILDNSTIQSEPSRALPATPPAGTALTFDAGVIQLGVSQLDIDQFSGELAAQPGSQPSSNEFDLNQYIDQYATVTLNASGGVLARGTVMAPQQESLQGSTVTDVLNTQGSLAISTPLITGITGASQMIVANGALDITAPSGNPPATVSGGLGVNFTLQGSSVTADSNIVLPSGILTLHATAGDVQVGGRLDVSGVAQNFIDLVEYTDGGQVNLASDTGNVTIGASGIVDVSAQPVGGNAGTLSISAPAGALTVDAGGQLLGQGGAGGQNGSFSLDANTITGGFLSPLVASLDAGGFTQSISIRDKGDSSIVVDGVTVAQNFNLSSDSGSITVTGEINASGLTGGTIDLEANGNLIIQSGAVLTVAGQYYDDAGQGGTITLEAGDETNGSAPVATQSGNTFTGNGYLDIQAGSTIDLGVANQLTTSDLALGYTTDIRTDLVAGTLHLRAPQTTSETDVQINPINGTINGAGSIVVEGYQIFNASSDGSIDNQEANVLADGQAFVGPNGAAAAGYAAMQSRLFSTNANGAALEALALIEPGAEIINPAGDLTLASNWDLSSYRFGPDAVAGDLTLRASGNLVFDFGASLSDGFVKAGRRGTLWQAQLMPVGSLSWSYRLVAGADFSAADFRQVQSLATLIADNTGSLLLGEGSPALPTTATSTSTPVITAYFQTIRTGAGTIDIDAGQDVQLLNPVATIYTAGSQAVAMTNFDLPNLAYEDANFPNPSASYPAQYSMGGGNVTISAQNNIAHYIVSDGTLQASSSLELPDNWLYRQGWIDPTTGQFGAPQADGNDASTSWWIDFSNFFEGVGALGGGNVTLTAGHNITNVDAVVPTNARMPDGTPDASALLELGGGDLLVKAGGNISGGVYYVERGNGVIQAGNDIMTNSTRAALSEFTVLNNQVQGITPDPTTWLPTTLFLGEGSFDVSAGGDLLLGSVVNPFLLPQGINNSFLEKDYFSTYATSDAVDLSSLTGDVTIKNNALGGAGSLLDWFTEMGIDSNSTSWAATSEPWLGLAETAIPSETALALMPATLQASAFSGDINIVGSLILSPSPRGTIDLAAAGSINGVQPNAVNTSSGETIWASSVINLSDANPNSIPGITDPVSFAGPTTDPSITWDSTDPLLLAPFNLLFNDSGSTLGIFAVLQTQEALHAPGLLHAGDPNPDYLSADSGDISGITLYSPKVTMVVAGEDITDVSLYIQNDNAADVSVVAAGRDILPYDADSQLRIQAQEGNNEIDPFTLGVDSPGSGAPNAGDIQIAGPGTLEVLAGRNLNLGVQPSNADGTGLGITSIGNSANPFLPFGGASIITGAGIGDPAGLDDSQLGFTNFIAQFLDPAVGGEAARYLPDLGGMLGLSGADDAQVWSAFEQLAPGQQDIDALDIFYLVLRDAGRDHNDASTPGFGNYDEGYAAIAALFPGSLWQGDITLTSREIKTENGGDIDMFAPGGELNVGLQITGAESVDQGILTQNGGNISIYTEGSVNVGTSRIFTLRGGSEIIWSTDGNIDAGASSKTVQSAPPTRVLIDPQSADVQTDLSGLATGGGIGVLATVVGVPVGDVDLIAPQGTVDAGDAGIRATGNLNIAAVQVLNASNISVGGASVGTPAAAAAPNIGGLTAGSNTAAAGNSAANEINNNNQGAAQSSQQEDVPSVITVEVLGYGGGESLNEDPRKKKPQARRKAAAARNGSPLAMNTDAADGN